MDFDKEKSGNDLLVDKMSHNNLNQFEYTSCIRIFGVPILPPLITEERKNELNDYKQRAIEIENRLKEKRNSIDSGVMTGYETQQSDLNHKCSGTTEVNGTESDEKETEEEPSSPPRPRIRRNSYTLESPSSVLLEHMAKEIANGNNDSSKWQTLEDRASDSETYIVQKDNELQSASMETSPTSLTNNPSRSIHSNSSTDNSSVPHVELSDSASQISVHTESTYVQQSSVSPKSLDTRNQLISTNRSEDFDDIVSLCSSMSISRFLPTSDISRPSTAETLSDASISQLKIKHEQELRELLKKQRQEEEIYSQLLSASGSLSSRTTTNLSIGDLFETNSEVLFMSKGSDSCNRELFPSYKFSPNRIPSKLQDGYSEREKDAATKLTACVKGYLTRRLLKTEKVQQLIELIKESLTCAFSLQLEPHLKPNDLDLHARLAHQLTSALSELQSIVSSPAAVRMAIIAADRERLRKPASRPSSTISAATRKSILRRQQSLNSDEKKSQEKRARTKSFSSAGNTGSVSSETYLRSDSSCSESTISSRKPWR